MSSDAAVLGLATGLVRAAEDRGESQLASAAAVLAGAERDIDLLWQDSVASGDTGVSDRLAELSHALRRAARVVDGSARAIG